ncbi:MAG: outer membrane beta-barrel protein [Rhodospirillaceae bacterium]
MQFRFTHVAIGVALAVSSVGVMAQSSNPPATSSPKGYYMPYERNFWSYAGGAIGRSDYDVGCRAGFSCDSHATGLKAFAGGKFTEYSGLEASYVYLGNAERAGGDTWGQGINLSLVGTVPLGQSLGLNGKVGAIYGWTKTGGAAAPGFATGRDHGLGLSYGLGLTYALSRNVDLRLDWDRYRLKFTTGRDDVDLGTVGVAFKF